MAITIGAEGSANLLRSVCPCRLWARMSVGSPFRGLLPPPAAEIGPQQRLAKRPGFEQIRSGGVEGAAWIGQLQAACVERDLSDDGSEGPPGYALTLELRTKYLGGLAVRGPTELLLSPHLAVSKGVVLC